jgi:hypothetical protein
MLYELYERYEPPCVEPYLMMLIISPFGQRTWVVIAFYGGVIDVFTSVTYVSTIKKMGVSVKNYLVVRRL